MTEIMTSDEIEVGQTYRATVDGLQAKARWDSIEAGDVIYIERITSYGVIIQQIDGPAGGGLTLDEIWLFERVGFHPDWNSVLLDQTTARLLSFASKKSSAKKLLNELPDTILEYESEITRLKAELVRLTNEKE